MILYMDSDSIVKRYARVADEVGIDEVRELVNEADAVATSIVAYAEVRAALAAARRGGKLRRSSYITAVDAFNDDWPRFAAVIASNELILAAGELAERHALRGYDSVHLASALVFKNRWAYQSYFRLGITILESRGFRKLKCSSRRRW
jgi:predicted nucleic acid-binding protein